MSASMKQILILGATSGIGEAFAKRFHSQGKSLILTGRNEKKLAELKAELPGIETRVLDQNDLANLPERVNELTTAFPKLDTVWVNGGIQKSFQFADPSSSTVESIALEVTTNLTAPIVLAKLFIPHLIKVQGTFMITASGLSYVPLGTYPVYCPTKAAVHSFLVGLRQQMKDKNVNVIEITPPYVATQLDAAHPGSTDMPAMKLQDFTDQIFEILDKNDAKDLKEVAVGFAAMGVGAWRGAFGPILEGQKIGG